MKTCSIRESESITPQHLANLLEFIPALEDPSFCPGGILPLDETGQTDEDFQRIVSRLMDACYKNGFVVRFDWEKWEAEGKNYVHHPELLKEADFNALRRLLTWHIRQNRFARNHFAAMTASGHVLAILLRLREVAGTITVSG
jgi:hypothetical protein